MALYKNSIYIVCSLFIIWAIALPIGANAQVPIKHAKTLFYDPTFAVNLLKGRQITMSLPFATCADNKLTASFTKATGFKISKQTSVVLPWSPTDKFVYTKGDTSRIDIRLYINYNWNPVKMCWRSKSGRVYNIADEDINCDDLEFWFEGMDIPLYSKQLFPGDKLPFDTKNLGYQLAINRLVMDATWELTLKKQYLPQADEIKQKIYKFRNNFNDEADRHRPPTGVLHNMWGEVEGNKLWFDAELGSATGTEFYRKLLLFLSSLHCFEKVEID